MFYYYNYLVYMLAKIWFGQIWPFLVPRSLLRKGTYKFMSVCPSVPLFQRKPLVRFGLFFAQSCRSEIRRNERTRFFVENSRFRHFGHFRSKFGHFGPKNCHFDPFLPNASLVLSGFHYGNCYYAILQELPSVDAGKNLVLPLEGVKYFFCAHQAHRIQHVIDIGCQCQIGMSIFVKICWSPAKRIWDL